MRLLVIGAILAAVLGLPEPAQAGLLPARVLVIYNSAFTADEDKDGVPDSFQVARYYARLRGVPETNLLALACSGRTAYAAGPEGEAAFFAEVVEPVRRRLEALGPDAIDCLLFIYGMPWMCGDRSLDNRMMVCWDIKPAVNAYGPNPYLNAAPMFSDRKDWRFSHAGFARAGGRPFYLTCRLDGPLGVRGALNLADAARYAERYLGKDPDGFTGVVYVDSRNLSGRIPSSAPKALREDAQVMAGNYGSYEAADVNMASAACDAMESGLAFKWQNTARLIGEPETTFTDGSSAEAAPDALFYGGWYAINKYLDVWGWLPGSAASDLDSASLCGNLRATGSTAWGVRALECGVSAVAGVVGEPFANGAPRPNILIWGLLHGYSFAEAAGMACPLVGWMQLNIGDPLYTPFAPRPPVKDEQVPRFIPGTPRLVMLAEGGVGVEVGVEDSPEPEQVRVKVEYGPTTAYDQKITTRAYGRLHLVKLKRLNPGQDYHCRVTVKDPADHRVSGEDMTFTAPGKTSGRRMTAETGQETAPPAAAR